MSEKSLLDLAGRINNCIEKTEKTCKKIIDKGLDKEIPEVYEIMKSIENIKKTGEK